LYEPIHGQNVAWSLGFTYGVSLTIYGPATVNFTTVFVDTSSAWNSSTASLRVPVAGLYYLKLGGSPTTGYKLNMVLSVNSNPLMSVMDKMSNTCSQYWNSRSRSIITRLQQGDILTVTVPNGYVAWNYGQSWCLLDSLYRHRVIYLEFNFVKRKRKGEALWPF
jgi:hypothetical protein